MKKLMFALAAMAAGVAMADGIASANVVGYQTITRGDNQNFCNGSMFVNVSKSVYTLDDIKITVASPANDRNNYIVFMAAGSSMKVNKDRAYWWDSANSKWRIRNGKTKTADGTVSDATAVKIAAGEGFLCNFMQSTTTLTLPSAL